MAYELAFWSDPHPEERDPKAVYLALGGETLVEGLGDFAVEATLVALADLFPGLAATGATGRADWEGNDASVEFSWSPQHLIAIPRGDVSTDQVNAIIDTCIEVGGARLYDPQTGERFDSF